MVFVDFYATWCGPCKWMDKNVFNQQELGALMKEGFISIKVNVEEQELELVRQLEIQSIPTYGFFNAGGKLVLRQEGSMDMDSFVNMAQLVANTSTYVSSPDLNLSRERSPEIVLGLVSSEDPEKARKLAKSYISDIIQEDPGLIEATYEDWIIIQEYVAPSEEMDHESFQLSDLNRQLLTNAEEILEYNSSVDIAKDYYESTIEFTINHASEETFKSLSPLINRAYGTLWNTFYEESYPASRHEQFNLIRYYLAKNQKELYLPMIRDWLATYHQKEPFFHRLMGILVYEKCQDEDCIQTAETNLLAATKLQDDGENNLVLALFYHESKQSEKLKAVVDKAAAQFQDYDNYPLFQQLGADL